MDEDSGEVEIRVSEFTLVERGEWWKFWKPRSERGPSRHVFTLRVPTVPFIAAVLAFAGAMYFMAKHFDVL